jgi:teichuronic acid biosynthesis glycosyltransferase TuaC
MKVLSATTLFPNNMKPNQGVFVKERLTRLAVLPDVELKVIAPVPYFPKWKISHRWEYSQVHKREVIENLDIRHPRYFITPKFGMPFYGYFMAASLYPAIKAIQKMFDFDVIDSHYVYPDGFAAVKIGRILKVPVTITARGSDINLFSKFRTIRPLLRNCLNKADQIITVSQKLKDSILDLRIPSEKIHVIPNGVDCDKFRPMPQTTVRKQLGLPQDIKIILSVGNLVDLKGFDILIRSIKKLRDVDGYHDLMLIIAGEGDQREHLEGMIDAFRLTGIVSLKGNIPHKELCQWYNAADLFCLASSREGWPNVILESLACGTPVVATNVGGIPEILTSRHVGLICDRDEKSIAETIQSALFQSWDHELIVRHANNHTWEQAALSVYRVLEKTLSALS